MPPETRDSTRRQAVCLANTMEDAQLREQAELPSTGNRAPGPCGRWEKDGASWRIGPAHSSTLPLSMKP